MSPGHRRWLIGLSAVAVAAGAIGLAIVAPIGSGPPPEWIRVGSSRDVARRGVTFVAEIPAFVVATRHGPIALYARDPHLGEPITYCKTSGWFEDRIHGSKFDRLGRYELGPAPRGLDGFEVHVVEDEVWVDPTNLFLGRPRGAAAAAPTPSGPFCTNGS